MTDQELQDIIRLKNDEQPSEEYFNEFLADFQQRQRAAMLKTSARGLLIERVSAWFSEFGAFRWVAVAGATYAVIALGFYALPIDNLGQLAETSAQAVGAQTENNNALNHVSDAKSPKAEKKENAAFSMAFTEPVDFSSPAPAISTDERIF